MNNVNLLGRICCDIDFKSIGQLNVSSFNLAVRRTYKQDGEYKTDFFKVSAFGKQAEFCNNHFSKGMQVCISGSIQNNDYTNKEGKKVYETKIIAKELFFADTKKEKKESNNEIDDLPF
jgi:single-strand DNA-binding protein